MDLSTRYMTWLNNKELLCQMYIFFVNHRLQDSPDPLTHTLIIMSTTPIQFAFCEFGILPFRTSNLPVYPFNDMTRQQRVDIAALLAETPRKSISESVEGCGKISVSAPLGGARVFADRMLVPQAFIRAVNHYSQLQTTDTAVLKRFCRIIFQRFISSVSLLPSQINEIMHCIDVMTPVAIETFPSSTLQVEGI